MNVEDMTPEQLREYALAKEARREELTARYMDREPAPAIAAKNPWERDVEFEGETYRVDMRRVKTREFLRAIARFQGADDVPIADTLALYDLVFGGEVDDKVCRVVMAKMGYEDYEEIMRIESGIFEAIDLKN